MLDQLQIQLRKKVRDLKTTDSRKANEVSRKADEVAGVSHDCMVLFDELSSKPDDQISDTSVFIGQYFTANQNILVGDVIIALKNNGYTTDWIQINPEQILDIHTFVSLIICSEKQGNRNVKSL
jgi:hypothetical protein